MTEFSRALERGELPIALPDSDGEQSKLSVAWTCELDVVNYGESWNDSGALTMTADVRNTQLPLFGISYPHVLTDRPCIGAQNISCRCSCMACENHMNHIAFSLALEPSSSLSWAGRRCSLRSLF